MFGWLAHRGESRVEAASVGSVRGCSTEEAPMLWARSDLLDAEVPFPFSTGHSQKCCAVLSFFLDVWVEVVGEAQQRLALWASGLRRPLWVNPGRAGRFMDQPSRSSHPARGG